MKITLFNIAAVCALLLAGFTPVQSACNYAAGPAYSQCDSEISCCAKNRADAGEPYGDTGPRTPASGESSCDYCQFIPDAAVATASAVSYPCNLFGNHATSEHLPLLAGHALPLVKPPPAVVLFFSLWTPVRDRRGSVPLLAWIYRSARISGSGALSPSQYQRLTSRSLEIDRETSPRTALRLNVLCGSAENLTDGAHGGIMV